MATTTQLSELIIPQMVFLARNLLPLENMYIFHGNVKIHFGFTYLGHSVIGIRHWLFDQVNLKVKSHKCPINESK